MKNIILIISFFTSLLSAQAFIITNDYTIAFTFDKYDQKIYYVDHLTSQIKSLDLNTGIVSLSNFPVLPSFANQSHKAMYDLNSSLYLYDFDLDTTFLLGGWKGEYDNYPGRNFLFSPNDKCFLIDNDPASIYSFEDSSFHELNIQVYDHIVNWIDDSTLFYIEISHFHEYNVNSGKDTVFFIEPRSSVQHYDYNRKENFIAYCGLNELGLTTLFLYDKLNNTKTAVFDATMAAYCFEGFSFESFAWNQKDNELAFVVQHLLEDETAGILLYNLDSSKTHYLTECEGVRLAQYTTWLNDDIIAFIDNGEGHVYGVKKKNIVASMAPEFKNTEDLTLLNNYPNPFNASTKIVYYLKEKTNVIIEVVDILGRKLETLFNGEQLPGNHELNFNGENYSSGVYFILVSAYDKILTKKIMLIK